MQAIKIIVERHPDTYVAYPLGIKGVVVGQGDTYDAALADVQSALQLSRGNIRRRIARHRPADPRSVRRRSARCRPDGEVLRESLDAYDRSLRSLGLATGGKS